MRIVLAVLALAGGSGLVGGSGFHFLRMKGTPVPFSPPPKLVDTGPYRHVRNPMVAGLFLILLGLGFYLDSFSLVVFFTPLYILFHIWELKNIEEPELARRLGAGYEEYRRNTPMFVPRFWKK